MHTTHPPKSGGRFRGLSFLASAALLLSCGSTTLLAQSSASISESVAKRNTIGVLTATPSTGLVVGTPVGFTYVLYTAGAPAPTSETIQFMDGSNPLGSPVTISSVAASNLLPYSQVNPANGWIAGGTAPAVTANAVDGADGSTKTASTIAFPSTSNGTSSVSLAVPSATSYAGQTMTVSVWLQSASGATVTLGITDSPQVSASQATPCVVTSTWARCTLTYTFPANAGSGFALSLSSTGQSAQSVKVWGMQVEQAAVAGPYVSTIGVARPTGAQAGTASLSWSDFLDGTHNIAANYAGDANFVGSTSNMASLAVGKAAPTIALSATPAGTSVYGQSVTFTASITGPDTTPTGTVTFMNGSTTLGTGTLTGGVATVTFTGSTSLPVGTYSVTAVYSGDTNFTTLTSSAMPYVVTQASTSVLTTTLTSSLNPSIYGDQVTYSATVLSSVGVMPTGTVTFVDGATTLGTGTLDANGKTSIVVPLLTAGSHTITATYGGNSNYQ